MPSMLRINQDPPKVYFSAKEACKILDCSKDWLRYWTLQMGLKTRKNGTHHRYTPEEVNKLQEKRQEPTANFDYNAYMKEYMRKEREQGRYKYIKKFDHTIKKNLEKR